jgi:hypothetical protein
MNSSRPHHRPASAGKHARPWPARWLVLVSCLLIASPAAASDTAEDDSVDVTSSIILPAPGENEVLPAVDTPFHAGEWLKFSVQWGPIHAGTAILEVPTLGEWHGHPAYTLVARAQSNAFVSRFYKVRNFIESIWDRDAKFSYRYREDRHEGKYTEINEIVFDQEHNEAHYKDGRTFPVPPRVQDALSAFYYARTQALPIGGSLIFDYHASRKSQPLEVRVLGRERVTTPAGTFNCVVIEPLLRAGGVFKNKGKLWIWLTDDDRRMPVMMKSKVAIGSVSVILQQAKEGS